MHGRNLHGRKRRIEARKVTHCMIKRRPNQKVNFDISMLRIRFAKRTGKHIAFDDPLTRAPYLCEHAGLMSTNAMTGFAYALCCCARSAEVSSGVGKRVGRTRS
jgi:hypothetical protein